MTKSQLIKAIASKLEGTTQSEVRLFLEVYGEVIEESLVTEGGFRIPNIVKFTVVGTSPKPERVMTNPFTKAKMKVGAKPASKRIKAKFMRHVKEVIGQVAKKAKVQKVAKAAQ
jgi:nucleoid DNA-binding protein